MRFPIAISGKQTRLSNSLSYCSDSRTGNDSNLWPSTNCPEESLAPKWGPSQALLSGAVDADQTNVRIAEFGADASDVGPGTLHAGRDGIGGGLGQGARDDIADEAPR